MIATNVRRKYSIHDSKLSMIAIHLCDSLTRDYDDVKNFGVTLNNISELAALKDIFANFKTDKIYLSECMSATEHKKLLNKELKESIRKFILRFHVKWGVNSFEAKSLESKGMNNMTDNNLIALAYRILEKSIFYFDELSIDGLTQDTINDFSNLLISFENAIDDQKNNINLREIKAQERIVLGNQLYDLVAKYCEIGKITYAMSNPAKYKDYLIYK